MWYNNKLMKKYIVTMLLIVGGFIGLANAQETFVGVQVQRINPNITEPVFRFDRQTDSVGPVVSFTNYETKNLGLTAEGSAVFSGENQTTQLYTALGGLTLKSRSYNSVQPYVKALAGVGISRVGNILGDTKTSVSPTYKAGVGVDLGKGKVKFRLIEGGYQYTRFYDQRQDAIYLSSGIVF